MTLRHALGWIDFLLLLLACNCLRTELYREAAFHRSQAACTRYQQGDCGAAQSGLETIIDLDPDYGPAQAPSTRKPALPGAMHIERHGACFTLFRMYI